MFTITDLWLLFDQFSNTLQLAEYAGNSIRAYRTDIAGLLHFLKTHSSGQTKGSLVSNTPARSSNSSSHSSGQPPTLSSQSNALTKESLIAYKQLLIATKKPATVNRKVAAINRFLTFIGADTCLLKQIKIQPTVFTDKELKQREFDLLIETAMQMGKRRIAAVMLTLAGTGIRVSELRFFTVASIISGYVSIRNKGKERLIVIPKDIQQFLKEYCHEEGIRFGCLFVNKQGKPLSRTYLAAEMRRVAAAAGVESEKVFPHNLRHFFARRFLEKGYPVTDLADHLGHKSIDTTRRYLYTTTATRRRQLSRMNICTDLRQLYLSMRAG